MPPPDPSIAAIIVSHESAATIDDCLQRLRACDGVDAIRVVDNGSRDGTLAIVQRHALADPRLRFVANPDNPGFSVACNAGAADVDAQWLAFVNPDCLVEPDSLARLRAHALTLGGDAVLGADLVDEHGVRDAAARRREPNFAAMLASTAARDLSLAADDEQALQPVDAVSGALMLLSRALFERLGGFDTGYRLHAEDLDLCRRARESGATVAVANDIRVLHVRGVSSRARPLFVEWHKHRGLWRYFRKYEAARRSVFIGSCVWAAIWSRFALAVLRAALRIRRH
jgi:GT2 family glycosyltransferase